ncbi:MAG: CRISPR-associated ring nuclease Csm6 [Desulfobacteraceae bacterium]
MKNILLAVTGLSPQVITETLFALYQNARMVDAIHVITTKEGRDRIFTNLLGGKNNQFDNFLREYDIAPSTIDFSHNNIHVVTDDYGVEIKDIITEEDNTYLLKKCLELAFRFTSLPESSVFFSVAGGRKTMSSCLTLAAQMYGRPQDRIFHVLVSPEFEGNPNFYYPPKESTVIELRDQNNNPYYKDTAYAEISLIPIPFVSIREHLSPEFLKEPKDPGTLMLSLIREESPTLTLNLITRKLIYKKLEMDIMPAWAALYAFFLMIKKECQKETATCGTCTDCFIEISDILKSQHKITGNYKKIYMGRHLEEMSDSGITNLTSENFNMYKGKLKKKLLTHFGQYSLKDLEIASEGTRPGTRYGIRMGKEKIEIVY